MHSNTVPTDRDGHSKSLEEYEDRREKDSLFQSAVATSQSALQFAAISENEKKTMRTELQNYLSELQGRRGSDGNLLVHTPSNFEEVANAMDRGDLEMDAGGDFNENEYEEEDREMEHFSSSYGGSTSLAWASSAGGAGSGSQRKQGKGKSKGRGKGSQRSEEVPWSKYLLSRDSSYLASLETSEKGEEQDEEDDDGEAHMSRADADADANAAAGGSSSARSSGSSSSSRGRKSIAQQQQQLQLQLQHGNTARKKSSSSSSRYADLDTAGVNGEILAQERLTEALAHMQLLDSKLRAVARRDLQLQHDLASRSVRDAAEADFGKCQSYCIVAAQRERMPPAAILLCCAVLCFAGGVDLHIRYPLTNALPCLSLSSPINNSPTFLLARLLCNE
jgi:hypothetical protein